MLSNSRVLTSTSPLVTRTLPPTSADHPKFSQLLIRVSQTMSAMHSQAIPARHSQLPPMLVRVRTPMPVKLVKLVRPPMLVKVRPPMPAKLVKVRPLMPAKLVKVRPPTLRVRLDMVPQVRLPTTLRVNRHQEPSSELALLIKPEPL